MMHPKYRSAIGSETCESTSLVDEFQPTERLDNGK
jgi:hypothetical protein